MAQEPACYFSAFELLLPRLANRFLASLCFCKPIEQHKLMSECEIQGNGMDTNL
jgi:hypothetical protein